MQQWWFDGGFWFKPVLWSFTDFPLNSRFSLIFMTMQITLT